MLQRYSSQINIVLAVLLLAAGWFMYKNYTEKEMITKINNQNVAALDSMQIVKDGWVQKYSSVVDLNADKDSLLDSKDETILTLQTVNVGLHDIISQGAGVVVYDTVTVPNPETGGLDPHLRFFEKTDFYEYTLFVWSKPLPWHQLEMSFKPFSLNVFLTRNVEGLWSGYASVSDELKQFITIAGLNVSVDQDEYARVETERIRWDLGLGGGVLLAPEMYFGISAEVLYNRTHGISYTNYLGANMQAIGYKYYFNIKK